MKTVIGPAPVLVVTSETCLASERYHCQLVGPNDAHQAHCNECHDHWVRTERLQLLDALTAEPNQVPDRS